MSDDNYSLKIQQLEEEVKTLRLTIDSLNQKLRESEAMKSNFISNVMNEIYNPFSSILSLSQNIMSLSQNEMAKAIPLAQAVFEEASALDFDLNNIFTAARIEAGLEEPVIKNVIVQEVIPSFTEGFETLLRKKNLTIQFNPIDKEDTESLKTDSNFLKQIVKNIVHNAIKFSPKDSFIELNSDLSVHGLHLNVIDQGTGIAQEDKQRIFDRFRKLDTTVNSINSGYGLGLSVVLGLLDLLNGTIEATRTEQQGNVISIFIPNSEGYAELDDLNESDFLFSDGDIF